MSIFNLLKKVIKKPTEKTETFDMDKIDKMIRYHQKPEWHEDYMKHVAIAEQNKYIDDKQAQKHFNIAYELAKDSITTKHFLLNKLIDYYYGLREQQNDALEVCISYCEESIEMTPKVLKQMEYEHKEIFEYDHDFVPPSIPAFKRLAIIYENQGNYDKAINVCQKAIDLGLKDGTKSGFEGRIERLKKKINV